MAVERVDYYSDEEFDAAVQAQDEQHRKWVEEQEMQQLIHEQRQEEFEENENG